MLGKIESRKGVGETENEMVGWHHQLNGHEFKQARTLGVGDGQGSLACCSAWGCKESDTTELSSRFIIVKNLKYELCIK